MSGQQIGSVVGFVVGYFFGVPQLGAMIGGMIGGAIDPTEIKGPHIGDGPAQSSQEGVPIPWVMGTFGWIQGNIVQVSARREVKKEDDGKGSGQVQVTYEAHQDYCIMVCESSETRGSTVVGPLMVKIDGKIVYDMRPGKNFGAQNAKFLANHTFYTGAEDQVPDPTMEAIVGVGNALSYRGVFTCVARDINLTQYGDRIPVYEWVMVAEGTADTTTTVSYVASELARFQNADDPRVDAEDDYAYVGVIGTTPPGGSTVSYTGTSVQDVIDYFTNLDYSDKGGGSRAPSVFLGYSASTTGIGVPSIGYDITDFGLSNATDQPDVTDNEAVFLVYNDFAPDHIHADTGWSGYCSLGETIEQDGRGVVAKHFDADPGGQYQLMEACSGAAGVYGLYPLCIRVTRKVRDPQPAVGDPCLLGEPTLLPDSSEMMHDCDGNITPVPTYSTETGAFKILQVADTDEIDDRFQYVAYAVGPVLKSDDPDYDSETFWTNAYDAAVARGDMEAGLVYGDDYPILASSATKSTASTSSLATDAIDVADAIEAIAVRGGLTTGQLDTADVDQSLLGYAITSAYDGADSIRPLLTAYGLYGAEYDGKIHFHKLGEDADLVIDPDEMIAGETQTDQAEREQAIEYPRVILLNYIDPAQDYAARPQPARRISPDVRAIGEETMQVPVVMSATDAARTADTYLKRATARAQGTRKFSVPFAGEDEVYLKLHPGKAFGLDGKRWVPDKLFIEDGEIAIEASYDRQSAYTSNVSAIPAPDPTPPPSSIGGVTLFAAMNLPRLRSKDITPGMYIAVAGLLDAWPGCVLQMSVDDGATWTTAVASMTQPSVMGYLTADLDTDGETLSVAVHGGELNSITDAQLSDGGNPCAIVTDAVAELIQFRDAAEIETGEYDLTELRRERLGTALSDHDQGDRFVLLNAVYFLSIDIAFAGRTIKFRPVTFGTVPENNATYDVVFSPLFTGPATYEPFTDEGSNNYVDESGNIYYTEV